MRLPRNITKIISLGIIFVLSLAIASNFPVARAAASPNALFSDDFNGSGSPDPSRWTYVGDTPDGITVGGGYLNIEGLGGNHKRINSIPTFSPSQGVGITARAVIRLTGDFQKFGFSPDPSDSRGGFFFDTFDDRYPNQVNYVRVIAWSGISNGGSQADLIDTAIPATWGTFHDFAVNWTTSKVVFLIDNQEVAHVDHAFTQAVPIGIWNDRDSLMQTDWVEVTETQLNTPPTIVVNNITLKSNTTGGRTLVFSDIGNAGDAEDGTPSVGCAPAIGSLLPLGSTTVSCTATDSGGLTTSDSGTVTVVTSITMGPQAMEGDLKVSAGDTLQVGYDFTMPGSHPATTVDFVGSEVTFAYSCVGSAGSGSFTVPIADQTYTDPANSNAWYPSGDQQSPAVFQGSFVIPSTLCGNGLVRLNQGGTFSSGVSASPSGYKVNMRWHYSAHASAGGWSGTKSIVPN